MATATKKEKKKKKLTLGRPALFSISMLNTETAEIFHELTMVSCAADKMNNSMLATMNESPFHHSFDVPCIISSAFVEV
jgi:hypothetical protein